MAIIYAGGKWSPHANIERVVECAGAGRLEEAQAVFDAVWEGGRSCGRREALEDAAKECVDVADPGIGGEWESAAMACAEAIRALIALRPLPNEHGPEQTRRNPASETDREPVGPGNVQRSENEADKRGKQE